MLKNKLKDYILNQLEEKKIEDIICIDTNKVSSLSSYVIIGSGGSSKQIESIMEHLKVNLKKMLEDNNPGTISGDGASGWIVYDLGDVIIHLFTPAVRKVYKLEELINSIKLRHEKMESKNKTSDEKQSNLKKNATNLKKEIIKKEKPKTDKKTLSNSKDKLKKEKILKKNTEKSKSIVDKKSTKSSTAIKKTIKKVSVKKA